MSGFIDRLLSSGRHLAGAMAPRASALLAIAAASVLAGCSLAPPAAVSDVRYDLGPAPAAPASAAPLPPVRLFDVRAMHALDSNAILYRLSYVDPHRASTYAHSHWTMAPAALLSQRLRAALAARGAVLSGGEAVAAPLLTVDLEQFEQVFDGQDESHGALTARATLTREGRVLAQHTFVARAPAAAQSAAGGVGALAAASDQFIAQLVAWLRMQTFVAAQ
ncbi:ABC-type transport auxiliary lipoprotein family protein [Trinickia caryophylli]|uniref:Cholesterol transport system auxiliary component n=1 Tax=Trinickia caryophylli TaxID=28094 RepID=A0A1X7ENU6_TRICW|nr:ABC-type transport auxiliary lipoprotein family protein [Trinickia caryophylli]PMS10261.1 ABC transporter [Trinickia caryophylli]TRX18731.1 ABC transporter [Trinickia caryophylli]WQE10473.1 ABC-type transport auxiliary lipoprotein family protein [Trinickia caryophylli]SMF37207.1 cholesterol transport system auxiliary component [Trinickia caryophylli]GLU32823.1 lipoprotein [Trinickia caryophylli]